MIDLNGDLAADKIFGIEDEVPDVEIGCDSKWFPYPSKTVCSSVIINVFYKCC